MSHREIFIIAVALLALITPVSGLAWYYRIPEPAVETDYEDDYDDDDYLYEDEPQRSVETIELPEIDPEFENTDIRQMSLRMNCPRLFRDDWYDVTLREFSAWAVALRREHGLAS